jgi:hypothetical protein
MMRIRNARRPKGRVLFVLLACGVCLTGAAVAWATETLTVYTKFTPNKLGAPTNLSATVTFASSTGGLPSPIRKVTAYGPAGLQVDVRGTGTCTVAILEGPEGARGCPTNSRIGVGGGTGVLELAGEVIREPFTLDFFLGPKENGHLVILVYVDATTPVSYQLVVTVHEAHGPKPYGWGATFEVPLISTLPGASYAAVEKGFFTIGDNKVAFFEKAHGRRKLVHVRGIVEPKTCPRGGFPYEVRIDYQDATTNTYKGAYPCPRK